MNKVIQELNELIDSFPKDVSKTPRQILEKWVLGKLAEQKEDNTTDIYNALIEQRARLEKEFEAISKRNRETQKRVIKEDIIKEIEGIDYYSVGNSPDLIGKKLVDLDEIIKSITN